MPVHVKHDFRGLLRTHVWYAQSRMLHNVASLSNICKSDKLPKSLQLNLTKMDKREEAKGAEG